jgi:antitoxin CptB
MKEMDLILGPFSETRLTALGDATLDDYDALLSENDPDIYAWVCGTAAPPARFAELIGTIAAFARDRNRPR